MRRIVIGILVSGFAAGACNKGPDAAGTPSGAQTGSAAVATSGAGDRAPELTPLEAAVRKTIVREITIPAGTELPVVLDTSVGSDTSNVEAPVRAHLSRAVVVDGQPVLAEGSTVSGVVTDATRSAKVKGRAHVAVRFDSVTPAGPDNDRYRMQTAAISRTAAATKKEDAIKIGAPAAGGAIIGAIVGGGDGAAIGAAAGGGAGTAVVLSTRGKEIRLPAGTQLRLRLTEPLTIRIKS